MAATNCRERIQHGNQSVRTYRPFSARPLVDDFRRRRRISPWSEVFLHPMSTGRLAEFVGAASGNFREQCESEFPWHVNDRAVWYALLVVEDGKIVRYGFISSKADKQSLCTALERLAATDEALLLGIWNGQYSTHLFVLEPAEALAHLKGEKKWARFANLNKATNVERICGPKGGFKYVSFEYVDESDVPKHGSTYDRDEGEELVAHFRSIGINVTETRRG
jgi:hypothetical protein